MRLRLSMRLWERLGRKSETSGKLPGGPKLVKGNSMSKEWYCFPQTKFLPYQAWFCSTNGVCDRTWRPDVIADDLSVCGAYMQHMMSRDYFFHNMLSMCFGHIHYNLMWISSCAWSIVIRSLMSLQIISCTCGMKLRVGISVLAFIFALSGLALWLSLGFSGQYRTQVCESLLTVEWDHLFHALTMMSRDCYSLLVLIICHVRPLWKTSKGCESTWWL